MAQKEKEIAELEKTWEVRLNEQKEKDLKEKQAKEEENKMAELNNKKAPHLTNLNEDSQLSGKLYYSLSNLANQKVLVGSSKSDPKPQIILRGFEI